MGRGTRLAARLISLGAFFSGLSGALAAPAPLTDMIGPNSEARIRVRIAEAAPMASVRGFDLRLASSHVDGASQWELRCQGDRVRAIQVGGAKTLELKSPVTIQTLAGFLNFRGRPYREELRIHAVGSLCEVINVVSLEKYLNGLVNAEFSSRWNEEAIAAQVIAARTYALYQMERARASHFDVDATVRDQVYDGSIREDTRASQSVLKTRGMVLTVSSGRAPASPIKAFYHSTCGGRTGLPEHVWGASVPGFRRSVVCPFCAGSPVLNWDLELSAPELKETLLQGARAEEQLLPGWPRDWRALLRGAQLVGVRLGKLDSAGKVAAVVTSWKLRDRALELPLGAARFRDWLGPARFRSTSFQIHSKGSRWSFRGRGNGHGVGMCQYGAKAMGEKGFKSVAILKHYYPDATVRKLW